MRNFCGHYFEVAVFVCRIGVTVKNGSVSAIHFSVLTIGLKDSTLLAVARSMIWFCLNTELDILDLDAITICFTSDTGVARCFPEFNSLSNAF
ncbi:hypothetical protein RJT34_15902 [Clitoria ternatea]|uniref:Uncharacterized protein n=1 Tax=Clitoria ternatea TaxID=43366 RepID=A0AAN9J7R2_CLITE